MAAAKPTTLVIDGKTVYSADELFEYDKKFFIGCAGPRNIINKRQITENDYVFAYKKKDLFVKSTMSYPRAKLFLCEQYVLLNVPRMMEKKDAAIELEVYKYEDAPEILELRDEEKFKTPEGKKLEIEVRGERFHNNCYFRVKDIAKEFDMPNLANTLSNINNYEKGVDYKVFKVNRQHINSVVTSSKIYSFMTYEGMIKLLYISRNDNARAFRQWATEKLFTIQMGEQPARDQLAADLIGVSAKTIADVFRASSAKTPVVYLYMILRAGDILEGTYGEDDLLCKYGCTDDMPRRAAELARAFKKEFSGAAIELLLFSIIETQFIYDAEKSVAQYFSRSAVAYENMTELVIINRAELPQIRMFYSMLQNNYIGKYKFLEEAKHQLELQIQNLQEKIKQDAIIKAQEIEFLRTNKEQEIEFLRQSKEQEMEFLRNSVKFEYELEKEKLRARADLLEKDLILAAKDLEVAAKENEILHMKLQLVGRA